MELFVVYRWEEGNEPLNIELTKNNQHLLTTVLFIPNAYCFHNCVLAAYSPFHSNFKLGVSGFIWPKKLKTSLTEFPTPTDGTFRNRLSYPLNSAQWCSIQVRIYTQGSPNLLFDLPNTSTTLHRHTICFILGSCHKIPHFPHRSSFAMRGEKGNNWVSHLVYYSFHFLSIRISNTNYIVPKSRVSQLKGATEPTQGRPRKNTQTHTQTAATASIE